jgi:chromate reductase
MNTIQLVGFVGSLASNSLNKKLFNAIVARVPEGVSVELLDIELPLYSQDREAAMPEIVSDLKKKIETSNGVLMVTPEYNRSIPGSLKNLLDWMSRPYGKNSFSGKVVAVAGATGGTIGTSLAQYHLKQVLVYLNATLFGQPEFMMSNADSKFDAEGKVTDEATIKLIDTFWDVFLTTIKKQG